MCLQYNLLPQKTKLVQALSLGKCNHCLMFDTYQFRVAVLADEAAVIERSSCLTFNLVYLLGRTSIPSNLSYAFLSRVIAIILYLHLHHYH
jgi:hypothetical protein